MILLWFGPFLPPAWAQLEWRVSIKFVLDSRGNRPGYQNLANCSEQNSPEKILGHFAYANRVLAACGRGYSFRVVEFTNVPGLEVFFDAPSNNDTRAAIENLATSDPDRYLFRLDAINIYILNTCEGGYSSRPPGELIIIGQRRRGAVVRPIHEIGHFFALCHTHGGGPCSSCAPVNPCPTAETGCDPNVLGDECVPDTLPDNCCWNDRDTVALQNFGVPYNSLSSANRQLVDNTWYNIMAYHLDHDVLNADPNDPNQMRHILTPDQLDIMTDLSNNERFLTTNGKTHFVDGAAGGTQNGSSSAPWHSVTAGLQRAAASPTTDIVLMRKGSYNERPLITFPVFLRASRGNVVIGTSSP